MKRIIQALYTTVYSMMMTGAAHANGLGHQYREQFGSEAIIVALGILTISSMTVTFLMGYFMPKNRKLLFPWHKRIAILTLLLAATHALMVLIF